VPYSFGDVLERAGDHEPAVGEAEQDDVAEVLVPDGVDDVGDVRGQAHLRARKVGALADAGQARREDLVAGGPERAAQLAEAVRATPCTVNQDKDRHQHQPLPPLPPPSARRRHPPPVRHSDLLAQHIDRDARYAI
jgi:hypothetical protein